MRRIRIMLVFFFSIITNYVYASNIPCDDPSLISETGYFTDVIQQEDGDYSIEGKARGWNDIFVADFHSSSSTAEILKAANQGLHDGPVTKETENKLCDEGEHICFCFYHFFIIDGGVKRESGLITKSVRY